ncbi:response regulator transcription factor [Roseomonas sp. NAR14]|uniref:Response regulator transcription factor n=1 Tax=Roseomonas acroporae TaxID=2937791 RepID=A0A9X1Y3V9_9PROT|nr:response regulator transcription factor [Roseomonas acroporae]MCK8782958.1 response regulator transcription factor [Roseomonas acroporae]
MRILVIEDEPAMADQLRQGLGEMGHAVEVAPDGRQGLHRAVTEPYDIIVTDRMLPGPDGLTILRVLRSAGIATPVLVLTALGEVESRVEGLDAGADDYLTKPFVFEELRARLQALARRPAGGAETHLRVADVEMDLLRRVVRRGGRVVELLPTEKRLLEYMLRHPGQVLTRTMLLEQVWEFNFDPNTNIVDVHVSRLRRKLDAGREGPSTLIRTVRGVGYAIGTAG